MEVQELHKQLEEMDQILRKIADTLGLDPNYDDDDYPYAMEEMILEKNQFDAF